MKSLQRPSPVRGSIKKPRVPQPWPVPFLAGSHKVYSEKDVAIAGHPFQSFGNYQVGDIAYADLNNDGMVDNNDQTRIGTEFPEDYVGSGCNFKLQGIRTLYIGYWRQQPSHSNVD